MTLDEVRARRPDVVLAPSEPYPFAERPRPAVRRRGPVVLVDGQDLFWWGARTVGAQARLAAQPSPGRRLSAAARGGREAVRWWSATAPPPGRPRHTTGMLSRVFGRHSTITHPPNPAPVTRAP